MRDFRTAQWKDRPKIHLGYLQRNGETWVQIVDRCNMQVSYYSREYLADVLITDYLGMDVEALADAIYIVKALITAIKTEDAAAMDSLCLYLSENYGHVEIPKTQKSKGK